MPPALLQAPAHLMNWAQSAILLLATLASCLVVRHLLIRWLKKNAASKDSARILLQALRFPTLLWCIVAAISAGLETAQVTGAAAKWARAGSVVFLVLSICVVISSLVVRLAVVASHKRGFAFGVSGVFRALIHIIILLIGGTVLLRYFKMDVAPLLTALGVGGLAVALALRDTLANFFAGLHILVEAPVSVGDFIRLSSGEEGTVTDIGWRTTRVLTGSNNIIVIPNEKITSSILTNYALPDRRVVTEVVILAGLEADVKQVMAIALEEAARVDGVLPQFAPLVLFEPGVTPTHLQMKLIVHVPNRLQQGMVQSDIRLRLHNRFRSEGIPLPAPERLALQGP
ncbi:MAG TPA: mechanosensitive ion channel family protein [Bryobacteraceae bacterium]|nr:mechanosensitive ion channel family protein [Bryobacteraceae bacterium]